MLKVAITKGRVENKFCELLKNTDYDIEPIINKDRKLMIKTKDGLEIVFAKANDVLNFVNQGITDIGIVGKDTLLECNESNYYELLDLETGKCKFCLAAYPSYKTEKFEREKKIATKYPEIAKRFFKSKNEKIKIVKLEGSVELGPVIGITDAIVDIVETGNTLKSNGLEVIEEICDISTRVIANKKSVRKKTEEVYNLIDKLDDVVRYTEKEGMEE